MRYPLDPPASLDPARLSRLASQAPAVLHHGRGLLTGCAGGKVAQRRAGLPILKAPPLTPKCSEGMAHCTAASAFDASLHRGHDGSLFAKTPQRSRLATDVPGCATLRQNILRKPRLGQVRGVFCCSLSTHSFVSLMRYLASSAPTHTSPCRSSTLGCELCYRSFRLE